MSGIPTLYKRLGGYDAVYAFIEYSVAKLMARHEVGKVWQHMSEERVKVELQNFCDFASAAWGGPAVYRGRNMIAAHKGMGITEAHWQELLEVLDDAYSHFELPDELRVEIHSFITSFKHQIVGSPSFREVVRDSGGTNLSGGLAAYGIHWPVNSHHSGRDKEKL